uniref:Uncharacterized protein n=1 Tax=Anguilla anguilla TaxID=7936 RepID=A0A0E9XSX7_ANGAN
MLNRKSQRNVTEAEPEFVTMDTLKEMLDQQKTIYVLHTNDPGFDQQKD